MTNRMKTTTAVLGGAVALASAAYAIGSQSGDGSATAASAAASGGSGAGAPAIAFREAHFRGGPGGPGGPRGAGLADLAEDLGVSAAKLRAALEKVRTAQDDDKTDKRDAVAAALAKALGKSTADVTKAMETVREQREDAFAAALAKSLGIDQAKVESALEAERQESEDEPGRGHRHGPGRFDDLADRLGVSEARLRRALRDAFEANAPDRDERPGPGGPRGLHLRFGGSEALANALGVTEQQLEDASDEVADALEAEHAKRRAAFEAALAKELGISVEKVRDALPDRPFGRRHR